MREMLRSRRSVETVQLKVVMLLTASNQFLSMDGLNGSHCIRTPQMSIPSIKSSGFGGLS